MNAQIEIDAGRIAAFCRKWKIEEFSIFGSSVKGNFRPDSDVDVLVRFDPAAHWSLYDWVDMIDELKAMFGREVDLVDQEGLINPYRRRSILENRQVVYAA